MYVPYLCSRCTHSVVRRQLCYMPAMPGLGTAHSGTIDCCAAGGTDVYCNKDAFVWLHSGSCRFTSAMTLGSQVLAPYAVRVRHGNAKVTVVTRSSPVAGSARAPRPPCSRSIAVHMLCGRPLPSLSRRHPAAPPLHATAQRTAQCSGSGVRLRRHCSCNPTKCLSTLPRHDEQPMRWSPCPPCVAVWLATPDVTEAPLFL